MIGCLYSLHLCIQNAVLLKSSRIEDATIRRIKAEGEMVNVGRAIFHVQRL